MVDPRRHAAALLAVLLLALPVPAFAQDATPTPDAQPPLMDEIPQNDPEPDEPEPDEPEPDEPEPDRETEPADTERLADTGLESGLVALLGLGLVASGSGLRVALTSRAD